MNRPFIGITCGTSALDKDAAQPQDRLNHAYSRAVYQAGGMPVLLPNLTEPDGPASLLDRLDGLLLSGGYDVDPVLFGEERLNDTVEVDGERDRVEMPLIRAAVERRTPLLAICRGIQALNVALGGTLWQDIPAQTPSLLHHRQMEPRHAATHAVAMDPQSRIAQIVGGARMEVNSFHHQAVKDLAQPLRVVARAEDGIIEAVEGVEGGFVLGVQFHPEEMTGVCEQARRIFRVFVEEAGRWVIG
jgi:putative glutamine amidotransferase